MSKFAEILKKPNKMRATQMLNLEKFSSINFKELWPSKRIGNSKVRSNTRKTLKSENKGRTAT
jgi:hypothetical protein